MHSKSKFWNNKKPQQQEIVHLTVQEVPSSQHILHNIGQPQTIHCKCNNTTEEEKH